MSDITPAVHAAIITILSLPVELQTAYNQWVEQRKE